MARELAASATSASVALFKHEVTDSVTVSCRGTPVPAFKCDLKCRTHYEFEPPTLALRSAAAN